MEKKVKIAICAVEGKGAAREGFQNPPKVTWLLVALAAMPSRFKSNVNGLVAVAAVPK